MRFSTSKKVECKQYLWYLLLVLEITKGITGKATLQGLDFQKERHTLGKSTLTVPIDLDKSKAKSERCHIHVP